MPDVMMALKKGEVQVAAGDYPVMKPYVDQYPGDYQFSNTTLSGTEYFGIVVSKDNPGLTAAMNSALMQRSRPTADTTQCTEMVRINLDGTVIRAFSFIF